MPLKLNVGLSKKIGQPNYGSLGASCHVECELDHGLVFDDHDEFQERVKRAFAACRQAVQDELTRQRPTDHPQDQLQIDELSTNSNTTSNGHHGHRASQKQLDYAQQLAGQVCGLGVQRLEVLVDKMFNKKLAELSSIDASVLIDVLKDIKVGKIELAAALNGVAA